jgi:hypothetical protein
MRYYDLYGARDMSIDELQQAVGPVVNLSFRRRYNDDMGFYFKGELGDEVFRVERNFPNDHNEEEVVEPEFANYPVLLLVSRTHRPDEIRDLLLEIPGLDHLRRDSLE